MREWKLIEFNSFSIRGRLGSLTVRLLWIGLFGKKIIIVKIWIDFFWKVLSRHFGLLIIFVVAAVVNYYVVPCFFVFLPIVFLIFFTFLPNTPQFYLQKGQTEVHNFLNHVILTHKQPIYTNKNLKNRTPNKRWNGTKATKEIVNKKKLRWRRSLHDCSCWLRSERKMIKFDLVILVMMFFLCF